MLQRSRLLKAQSTQLQSARRVEKEDDRLEESKFLHGKPVFHPTITPKAEEILQELTDIILADEKKEERAPKFIHA
ncbi:hypothetical protein Y032_0047g1534 [Ancylostoma ceylanicum]|uniref:Uncharacterized protein n=1 Tax=Ancylostoma ceylanicum TaxID=53326 RepID=A0A016UCA8_9BILA|nr:hypothetical protein Y032_0047g1534 [Ancylostoma ceylanicum]